jgi:hypothetical protein
MKQLKKRQTSMKLAKSDASFMKKLVFNILKSTTLMCCTLAGLIENPRADTESLKREMNK